MDASQLETILGKISGDDYTVFEPPFARDTAGRTFIYRGLKKSLNKTVAVKYVRSKPREEAKNEANAMTKLHGHKNIIEIYDFIERNADYIIVMEFVGSEDKPAKTLADLTDELYGKRGKTIQLVQDVCKALMRIHKAGICHRDVSPTNICISFEEEKPYAKVGDFGAAAIKTVVANDAEIDVSKRRPSTTGTPGYQAPEQAHETPPGKRKQCYATDIWPLGVILYEFLTSDGLVKKFGKGDKSLFEILMVELSSKPADRRLKEVAECLDIPNEPLLTKIVKKCLQEKPGERYCGVIRTQNVASDQIDEICKKCHAENLCLPGAVDAAKLLYNDLEIALYHTEDVKRVEGQLTSSSVEQLYSSLRARGLAPMDILTSYVLADINKWVVDLLKKGCDIVRMYHKDYFENPPVPPDDYESVKSLHEGLLEFMRQCGFERGLAIEDVERLWNMRND